MKSILVTIFVYLTSMQIVVKAQYALPSGCQDAFRATGLALHNQYRTMHGTPSLAKDSTLDTSSLSWANTMASTGYFAHSSYGENLWANSDDSSLTLDKCSQLATLCVSSWYNEIQYYNYAAPGFYSNTGHFTQVIWYSSTRLGMSLSWGKTFSGGSGRAYYCVAHYFPYGNDGRYDFGTQVLPLLSTKPTTRTTTLPTTSKAIPSTSIKSTVKPSIITTLVVASTSKSSSSSSCQDLASFANVCAAFSSPQYTFCTSKNAYVGGILFSKACPKSCRLC